MVIDSSAFIAILLGEPDSATLINAIISDRTRLASAATLLETSLVILTRKGEPGLAEFQAFVARAAVQVAAF
jgi:ribonuclease VapC